jgi:hypothetical protein
MIMFVTAAAFGLALQDTPPTDISLEMTGDGRWRIECTFQTEDGDKRRRARGRGLGHFERLHVPDATGGTCTYTLPERARLTVQMVDGEGLACPLNQANEGSECRGSYVADSEGSWSFQPAQ